MDDQHQQAARIDQLLQDLRSLAAGPVWQRIEELVQRLVQLYGAGLGRWSAHVREAGALDEALAARVAGDELLSSLLLLHDLHPWPVERRIGAALERARDQLQPHIGAVTVAGVAEGVLRVRLESGGSVSSAVAAGLVQRAIADAAPEIGKIEVEGSEPPRESLVQIRRPSAAAGAAR